MDPLITVIIPNYNHSPYLDERIQSVLNQTFKDFEVIILDDCSSDNSREIIENYRNNPQISHILFNDKNSGSTFIQWNKGFELAKGQYIWIAESDDVADTKFLEKIISNIDKNNPVLIFTNSHFIDSNSSIIDSKSHRIWNHCIQMEGISFVKRYLLGYNNIYNASAVVFKKEILANIPKEAYNIYKACGDRIFWIYVCLQGNILYIPEKLNYFRKHKIKVSPYAAASGLSALEDYQIYKTIKNKIRLNLLDRILINGHHYEFIHSYPFNNNIIRAKVSSVWNQEPEYSFISYLIYKIYFKFHL